MPIRMVGCWCLRRSSCAEWYSFAFYESISLPGSVEIPSGRPESQIAYPRRVVLEGQVSDAWRDVRRWPRCSVRRGRRTKRDTPGGVKCADYRRRHRHGPCHCTRVCPGRCEGGGGG